MNTTTKIQAQITYKVYPSGMSRILAEARGADREVTRSVSFDCLETLHQHILDFVGFENLVGIAYNN